MGSLQGVMGTWKLTRCDRFMGNSQGVIGTWETDKV